MRSFKKTIIYFFRIWETVLRVNNKMLLKNRLEKSLESQLKNLHPVKKSLKPLKMFMKIIPNFRF